MGWTTRVKIAAGAARGIAYLHEDCKYPYSSFFFYLMSMMSTKANVKSKIEGTE